MPFEFVEDRWQCQKCGTSVTSKRDLREYPCPFCQGRNRSVIRVQRQSPAAQGGCGTCASKKQTVWQIGWNFAAAVKSAMSGNIVSAEQYEERRALCQSCPSLQSLANADQCQVCKCFVAAKAALAVKSGVSDCPLGRWPIIGKLSFESLDTPAHSLNGQVMLGNVLPALSQSVSESSAVAAAAHQQAQENPGDEPDKLHAHNATIIDEPPQEIMPRLPRALKTAATWSEPPEGAIAQESRNVMLKIHKGLGDAVCFRSVLLHLLELRPNWTIDINCPPYHRSIFEGLCRRIVFDDEAPVRGGTEYDTIHTARFMRPKRCYNDSPCNTTQAFLRDVCRVTPRLDLCHNGTLWSTQDEIDVATNVLASIPLQPDGRRRAIVIHSRGRSFSSAKNPHQDDWLPFVHAAQGIGYTVVLVDFDRNNDALYRLRPLTVDHDTPGFAHGTQYGTALAALINQSALFVGVDSGPLHVASTCHTPALGIWLRHHPCHSYNLASNVTHLVPVGHAKYLPSFDRQAALAIFEENYRFIEYESLSGAMIHFLEQFNATPTTT